MAIGEVGEAVALNCCTPTWIASGASGSVSLTLHTRSTGESRYLSKLS